MWWAVGIYLVIAFIVGQGFQHPKESVHFDRMSLDELMMLGMGWPFIAILLIAAWIDYRRNYKSV